MTKVLVVDDEPQIRRALRTSLEAHGYEVAAVGTGEEGVLHVADSAPDLVLLDLGLPDIDGTEVVRRVRAFSEVPVIVLSVRDGSAGQGRRAGRGGGRLRDEAVRDGGAPRARPRDPASPAAAEPVAAPPHVRPARAWISRVAWSRATVRSCI